MKAPTLRKLRNRGLTPVRYRAPEGVRHGWILEERPRGGMTIRLVGEDRNTRLTADEARKYVTKIGGQP